MTKATPTNTKTVTIPASKPHVSMRWFLEAVGLGVAIAITEVCVETALVAVKAGWVEVGGNVVAVKAGNVAVGAFVAGACVDVDMDAG